MKTYHVEVNCNAYYTIEANNEEEAIDKAWDFFAERKPEFTLWAEEGEENEG